ncbi:MAG: hypothetical protein JSV09_10030 [Thermoplasmata archaeon]|nr:MAG: hypothetical protein JSV09_10030 [Thermoplasmata archaeon]
MKKQLVELMLVMLILLVSTNTVAQETDPCTIYGTVRGENGIAMAGAMITVENVNTNEKSSVGDETITDSPLTVTTDSDGIYIFELINLKSGYSHGDEIVVTAERDGIIASESTIVDNGTWGANVDITLVTNGEPKDKDEWYASLSDPLTFLLLLALIIAIIIILILLKRRKGLEPESSLIEEPAMREKPLEKEVMEEPESEASQIETPVARVVTSNEVAEEEQEPDSESSLAEETLSYECPECGHEIKEEDTSCANCGVSFAEPED